MIFVIMHKRPFQAVGTTGSETARECHTAMLKEGRAKRPIRLLTAEPRGKGVGDELEHPRR